jgi:NCS1 family nucleobase:cation symporter-1
VRRYPPTLTAYLVVVEVPSMSTTFYTGPLVAEVGGVDLSWIFGIVVAAGLYFLLMRPVVVQRAARL